MKKRWNAAIWCGFGLCLLAFFSYFFFFAQFPVTRDFPWVNLLLFAAGVASLVVGLRRAFRAPDRYRGRIAGPIVGILSSLVLGFFVFYVTYASRQLPAPANAPHAGQIAPDFSLPDQEGRTVVLSTLLSQPAPVGTASGSWVLLIFYRGYW